MQNESCDNADKNCNSAAMHRIFLVLQHGRKYNIANQEDQGE